MLIDIPAICVRITPHGDQGFHVNVITDSSAT
jgi:hypothetical protein